MTDPETVLGALDFAGVAVFAATGALAAAQQRHDLVTFAFFGAIRKSRFKLLPGQRFLLSLCLSVL